MHGHKLLASHQQSLVNSFSINSFKEKKVKENGLAHEEA